MSPYADTSFLGALFGFQYKPRDIEAKAWWAARNTPVIYSRLNQLETASVFRRLSQFPTPEVPKATVLQAQADYDAAVASGYFHFIQPPFEDVFNEADEIVKNYTAGVAARSLDILHLANAIVIGADTMLTFDPKLRDLSERAGMAVPFPKN